MKRYDLFCAIFDFLDGLWEENHDEALGAYLSDANPNLFLDEGSADPGYFLGIL